MIPLGYCQCGCGERTTPIRGTDSRFGYVAGQPHRFILGHRQRLVKSKNPEYRIKTTAPDGNIKRVYIVLAEKALGHSLPPKAEVHHIDGDPTNNDPANLVICPNHKYHRLLHVRQKALAACGNPNWRHCFRCKAYDDPSHMRLRGKSYLHLECERESDRARWPKKWARIKLRRTA